MNKFKSSRAALLLVSFVLVTMSLFVSSSGHAVNRPDAEEWVGYWKQDGAPYYLRIKMTPGGNLFGQLTHDENIGKVDEQAVIGKVDGNSWTGTWKSFPGNYRKVDKDGNTVPGTEGMRRGTFVLTMVSNNRIEGAQHEGDGSFINKGATWIQNFDRCPHDDCTRLQK